MNKVFIVGKYTFYEALKSRLLLNVIFLGIGLVIISLIASELTYGEPGKISLDIGFGLISLALKVIAVFYGVGILQQEIENRSIYLVLSRPISRAQYFLGRLVGMGAMLLLNVLILGPFSLLVFYFQEGKVDSLMVWTLFFTYLESLLLLLIVVVCSMFCSKVLSILLGITSYIAGYTATSLLESNKFVESKIIIVVLKLADYLLPNFSKLNLKDFVLYQQSLDSVFIGTTLLHTFSYMFALILLGSFLIERKSFD